MLELHKNYFLQCDGGGGPVRAQPVRGDGHRAGGEQLGRVDAHAGHLHPRRAHRLLHRHRHDLQRTQEGRIFSYYVCASHSDRIEKGDYVHMFLFYLKGLITDMNVYEQVKILVYMVVLSLNTPLGILIGILVTLHMENATGGHILLIGVLQGLAAGTLLYITFFEVLARDKLLQYGMSGLLGALAVLLGFSLMAGLEAVGGHSHGGHGHTQHIGHQHGRQMTHYEDHFHEELNHDEHNYGDLDHNQAEHEHREHDHDEHNHDEHNHDEHNHNEHDHAEHDHDEHDYDEHNHDEHNHDEHDHGKHDDGEHSQEQDYIEHDDNEHENDKHNYDEHDHQLPQHQPHE